MNDAIRLFHGRGVASSRRSEAGGDNAGDQAMEIATLIAAVVGGVTGLVNTVAIILVNGKVDRLTGRVDVLQDAVMKRPPGPTWTPTDA